MGTYLIQTLQSVPPINPETVVQLGQRVCGSGSFVPVASNLEPTQVQRQEVVTIRNIGPNRTGDMKN
jgi:hypothetical protein